MKLNVIEEKKCDHHCKVITPFFLVTRINKMLKIGAREISPAKEWKRNKKERYSMEHKTARGIKGRNGIGWNL